MKGIILPFLTILVLTSCNTQREKKLYFEPEMINYFSKDAINHFPKKIPKENTVTAISQNLSDSHPYIWVRFIADQYKFDSIYHQVSEVALTRYQSDDSCLVVIDKHLRVDNQFKYDKTLMVPREKAYNDKPCEEGKLPLPNFYDEYWRETDSSLTGIKGYQMFVLDAKAGLFMDSAKLPNGLYTPKGWKHGYSKGVAMRKTDRSVIYWYDIW